MPSPTKPSALKSARLLPLRVARKTPASSLTSATPIPSITKVPSWAAPTVPFTVAKHPGCYTHSVGACTAGTIYGMCGNRRHATRLGQLIHLSQATVARLKTQLNFSNTRYNPPRCSQRVVGTQQGAESSPEWRISWNKRARLR
jgi:hypothetical protein